MNDKVINEIISSSNRNLKKVFILIECYRFNIKYKCNWISVLDTIIRMILKPLNLKQLMEIREILGQLFITNIESENIMIYCQKVFIEIVKNPIQLMKILEIITNYDIRLKNATRYILHMEAMLLNINAVYHQMK
jgi:hypothetical protein